MSNSMIMFYLVVIFNDHLFFIYLFSFDFRFNKIMPLFTREFVSCHTKPFESHLYNDPVMLICSHVFCRSCCLQLAEMSNDQSSKFELILILKEILFILLVTCPICSARIPFDNLKRFANNLISHGTLATMVKQYLREENNHHRICYSCQNNYRSNNNDKLCKKCTIENENIKKKIVETMENCEELLGNQKLISVEKIHEEVKQLYEIINQRATDFLEKIDKYQEELENLLTIQEKANEINA